MSTEHITVGAAVRISNTESAPDLLRYLSLDDKYEIIDGTGQLVQVLTNHRFKRYLWVFLAEHLNDMISHCCTLDRTMFRSDLGGMYIASNLRPGTVCWGIVKTATRRLSLGPGGRPAGYRHTS